MKKKTIIKISSILLFLIFIAPYFYLTQHTFLSGDDHCRAVNGLEFYFENIAHWFTHSGRYTNAFLSYLPVYEKSVYRWTLLLSMGAFLGSLYYFINKTLYLYRIHITTTKVVFISLLFGVLIFAQLPDIYQFFYWYAAVTVYQYSVILFLLLLPRILYYYKGGNRDFLITSLLVILLIGNNEMFILITAFLLGALLLYTYWKHKELSWKILLLNVLSWVGAVLVVFMPGTGAKQTHYPDGGEILYSLKWAILSSGMFILKSLIEFPHFFIFLGLFLFLLKIAGTRTSNVFALNPLILGGLSYIGLMLVFFVPLYATGHIAVNSGRIGNIVHIIFLILLFFNIVNLSSYLSRYKIKLKLPQYVLPGIVLGFLVAVIFSQNYNYLISDIKGEELTRYVQDVEERFARLKKEDGIVRVKKIKETNLLKYYDVRFDSTRWENHCYVEMINYKYGRNIEAIVLEPEKINKLE